MAENHSSVLWDVPPEKFCPKCRRWKTTDKFGKVKGKIRSYCRECHLAANDVPDLRKEKRCVNCEIVKSMDEFSKCRKRFQPYCKQCSNERTAEIREENKRTRKNIDINRRDYWTRRKWITLKARYGITKDQYFAMLEKQNGVCAICKRVERESASPHRSDMMLSVDHCHSTKKVRGLLCRQCNIGIGRLQESVEVLRSAIAYLELNA